MIKLNQITITEFCKKSKLASFVFSMIKNFSVIFSNPVNKIDLLF